MWPTHVHHLSHPQLSARRAPVGARSMRTALLDRFHIDDYVSTCHTSLCHLSTCHALGSNYRCILRKCHVSICHVLGSTYRCHISICRVSMAMSPTSQRVMAPSHHVFHCHLSLHGASKTSRSKFKLNRVIFQITLGSLIDNSL
jgi:hypothetical protein